MNDDVFVLGTGIKRPDRSRVFIIGGGNSVKDVDLSLLKDEETIVVNNAIFDVPNPDIFITMDYSFFSKIDIEKFDKIECGKIFIANTVPKYIKIEDDKIFDKRSNICYNLSIVDFCGISNSYRYFKSNDSEEFSSGKNSGFCALQLAIKAEFDEIYLIGFDYTCKDNLTHYHGGYGEGSRSFQFKLDEYFTYIREAIENYQGDSKIFSCGKDSRVNQLMPYKDLKEIL